MPQKISVGAVSYLNTKPLIYGFEQGMMRDSIELVMDYPARIADSLIKKDIDIGLVPVTVMNIMPGSRIIGDYGIACTGEVASVCLFSDVPVENIETILLDYQSNASVALLKLLLEKHWKISPVLVHAESGYEKKITGATAGLVIGDRAFEQRLVSRYVYDLGQAWFEMTGLPFVFAAWISHKELSTEFIIEFNRANEAGLQDLDAVIATANYPLFDLEKYYTVNMQFRLDEEKKKGLALFLDLVRQSGF